MAVEVASVPTREEIPAEYTWDFTTIYADDAAWEADVVRLEAMLPEAGALQGTFGDSPAALLRGLRAADDIQVILGKIYSYARMRKDVNGSDASAQALEARAASLAARTGAALSFIEPEILTIPEATISAWQEAEPGLEPYRYELDQLNRRRPHIRSAEVEAVMAEFGDVTRGASDAFDALTDVDLTFPVIEDEEGRPIQLSNGRYTGLMRNPDRRVRHDAFIGLHQTYGAMRTTLASTLATQVRRDVLDARLHNYPSALAAALAPNDIPVGVYHNLLATVDANLPVLHRYAGIRRRILGVDELHAYDLSAPLVPDVPNEFDFQTAERFVREAFQPLGREYATGLEAVLGNRWIDVYENQGKAAGAYSGGSYATPPFVLLNYQKKLDDVYTLAHELGHSLHSYFTRRTQPPVSGSYTIFVAEVASTLNEALLTAYLLDTSDDPALRRQLLVQEIEGIRATLFRQAMFAQFELDMHQRVEEGEALTADWLENRYFELAKHYYGPDVVLDDEVRHEWSRIPHFYYDFYVYQYATGKSAALALSQQILTEGARAVERYLHFLTRGSSRPSIELLQDAGVDMTSPAPVQQAMDRFGSLLDQLEAEG